LFFCQMLHSRLSRLVVPSQTHTECVLSSFALSVVIREPAW
jgi:hypothetical protein